MAYAKTVFIMNCPKRQARRINEIESGSELLLVKSNMHSAGLKIENLDDTESSGATLDRAYIARRQSVGQAIVLELLY